MMKHTLNTSKAFKVFLFGAKSTGKTYLIEKLIFGNRQNYIDSKNYNKTIDDIYIAYVDNDRGGKEKIFFYDTCGLENENDLQNSETIKNYILYADAIVLVYSITNLDSFLILDSLKKMIDRIKDKKDMTIICLGNKIDEDAIRTVDSVKVSNWSQKEKIKLFDICAKDRKTLIEPFIYISSKLNQPQNKSTFAQLSRKVKGANYSMEL